MDRPLPNDPQWMADFEAALRELNGVPDCRDLVALPAKPKPKAAAAADWHHLAKPPHEFNPNRISDVMGEIFIKKTVHPLIREVYFKGDLLGKIAKSPWSIGWAADCDRRVLYASQKDAALRLFCEHRT